MSVPHPYLKDLLQTSDWTTFEDDVQQHFSIQSKSSIDYMNCPTLSFEQLVCIGKISVVCYWLSFAPVIIDATPLIEIIKKYFKTPYKLRCIEENIVNVNIDQVLLNILLHTEEASQCIELLEKETKSFSFLHPTPVQTSQKSSFFLYLGQLWVLLMILMQRLKK